MNGEFQYFKDSRASVSTVCTSSTISKTFCASDSCGSNELIVSCSLCLSNRYNLLEAISSCLPSSLNRDMNDHALWTWYGSIEYAFCLFRILAKFNRFMFLKIMKTSNTMFLNRYVSAQVLEFLWIAVNNILFVWKKL